MNALSQDFVSCKFSEFYADPSNRIPQLEAMRHREFAFLLFKEHIMLRHQSIDDIIGLKKFICKVEPSDVYHSCAYYDAPEADMAKKGWLGADLVFDIDADHIPTQCDKAHDEWTCKSCMFCGTGSQPEKCPECGGQRFDSKTWPCGRCIDSAKDETAKLLGILMNDFGFSESDVHVFFSGHRGYHVHVETDVIRTLDTMARKEIVDYVTGSGLSLSRGKKSDSEANPSSREFSLLQFGRYARLKSDIRKFIESATKNSLMNAGVKGGASAAILQYKQQVQERCIERGMWTSVNGIGHETWFAIAEYLTNLEIAKIDTVVTTDVHRLIRLNGTLHGKTGLKKVEFPVTTLMDFDPFVEAVAFRDGTAKVSVSSAPEFSLCGTAYGPYKNEKVVLPIAGAILLICKGRAEVVKD